MIMDANISVYLVYLEFSSQEHLLVDFSAIFAYTMNGLKNGCNKL